jgi:phosphocarrier protein
MYSQNVLVENKTGLHARPAAQFVQSACKFNSNIELCKNGRKSNAKSIIGVLSLGITKDSTITISACGEDEKAAVDTLVELIRTRFGEE